MTPHCCRRVMNATTANAAALGEANSSAPGYLVLMPFDSTSSVEKANSIAKRQITSLTSATPVQRYATASKWNRRAALWDVSSQRKSLNSARVRYSVVMRSSEPDARMRS